MSLYDSLEVLLEAAIAAFVTYYHYQRYRMALGNLTPADVLKGRKA